MRGARESDVEWLYALGMRACLDSVSRQFGSWEEDRQRALFEVSLNLADTRILERDGRPVGMFCVEERDDHIWLADIQVEPNQQGQGLGGETCTRPREVQLLALEL